jgi:hypothetical protein
VAIYIGVDPGASGGLAYLTVTSMNRVTAVGAVPMPDSYTDIWIWAKAVRDSQRKPERLTAVIELVGGYVGGPGNTGSSMFKFGASFGALKMALVAAGIPFEAVPPQKWQKEFGMHRGKKEKKHQYKARLKAKAQELFPENEPTLATCDALLIAEWCRRKHEGTLG